jgi:hypothetical protein
VVPFCLGAVPFPARQRPVPYGAWFSLISDYRVHG